MIAENDVKTMDEQQRIKIGMRIQEQRIKSGMSGAILGAYLGINSNQVSRIETGKAKQVLSAAAMTYVAALLVSIMSLLRLILRTRNRRN